MKNTGIAQVILNFEAYFTEQTVGLFHWIYLCVSVDITQWNQYDNGINLGSFSIACQLNSMAFVFLFRRLSDFQYIAAI